MICTRLGMIVGASALLALAPGTARAQSGVYVEYWDEAAEEWLAVAGFPAYPSPGLPSGSDITINNATDLTYRVWSPNYVWDTAQDIAVSGATPASMPRLLVGRGLTHPSPDDDLPTQGLWAVRNIGCSQGCLTVQLNVGIIEGDVEACNVVRIYTTRIYGSIIHDPADLDPAPDIHAVQVFDYMLPGTSIVATKGDIVLVHSRFGLGIDGDITAEGGSVLAVRGYWGSLRGDVIAFGGRVGDIAFPEGQIGPHAVTGEPVKITARDGIDGVHADSIESADLVANNSPDGSGDIGVIASKNLSGSGGTINRSIFADRLLGSSPWPAIQCATDLDADIVLNDSVLDDIEIAGAFLADRTISIGNDLPDGVTLRFGSIEGQIIINGNNAGGEWLGTVEVGPFTLGPPGSTEYTQTSAQLGGGAIGVAPFRSHRTDCVPPQDAVVYFNPSAPPAEARVRHYGPVTFDTGTGAIPYTVRKTYNPSPGSGLPGCAGTDVTAHFAATLNPANRREVVLTPISPFAFKASHDYCFTAVTDPNLAHHLKCLDVDGNPPVTPYSYAFTVGFGAFDLNADDAVDDLDVLAWTADPVDLNADGVANGQDLTRLLDVVHYGY